MQTVTSPYAAPGGGHETLIAMPALRLDAAFVRLRGYARTNNRRLSDVAGELIDGRLDPTALNDPVESDR